jgi:hypothetical protein
LLAGSQHKHGGGKQGGEDRKAGHGRLSLF